MKTITTVIAGVFVLAACGSGPEASRNDTSPATTTPIAKAPVDMRDRIAPKSSIGYVRRDVPGAPPNEEARRARDGIEAVRRELGPETFSKASAVLSCRAMGEKLPKDPTRDFARRAEEIRAVANAGADAMARELEVCRKARSSRR